MYGILSQFSSTCIEKHIARTPHALAITTRVKVKLHLAVLGNALAGKGVVGGSGLHSGPAPSLALPLGLLPVTALVIVFSIVAASRS